MSKSTTTQTTRAARNTGPEPEPAGFIVDLDDIARDQARTDHNLRIPQEGLAQVAIDAAIGARERRRIRRDGVAVIVEIPGADWAPEVEAILRSIGYFETVVSRSGASPKFDRPTEGNDKVAMSLASGRGVLGISSAPERFLPEVLVAAADVRVKLRAPGPREIATVIRMATGRRPRHVPPDLAAGLSFDDICTAIRLGSGNSPLGRPSRMESSSNLAAAIAVNRSASTSPISRVPPHLRNRCRKSRPGHFGSASPARSVERRAADPLNHLSESVHQRTQRAGMARAGATAGADACSHEPTSPR